jgi:hypothetical protein
LSEAEYNCSPSLLIIYDKISKRLSSALPQSLKLLISYSGPTTQFESRRSLSSAIFHNKDYEFHAIWPFFFSISHGENTNSGLDGTATLLMVTEKQFTVSHGTIQ